MFAKMPRFISTYKYKREKTAHSTSCIIKKIQLWYNIADLWARGERGPGIDEDDRY